MKDYAKEFINMNIHDLYIKDSMPTLGDSLKETEVEYIKNPQLEDIAAELHAIGKILTPFNNQQYDKIEQELEDINCRLKQCEKFIDGMMYTE